VFFARKPGLPPPAIKGFDAGCIFFPASEARVTLAQFKTRMPGDQDGFDRRAFVSSFEFRSSNFRLINQSA
jgi:hypothetical protein